MIKSQDLAIFVAMWGTVFSPTSCRAAVAFQEVPEHQDYPGACYIEETGMAYQVGQSWQPKGACWLQTCHEYEQGQRTNTFLISMKTCGLVWAEPPCVLVENSTASYPDCCPKYVCPQDASPALLPALLAEADQTENEVPSESTVDDYDVVMGDDIKDYDDPFPSPLLKFYKHKYGVRI